MRPEAARAGSDRAVVVVVDAPDRPALRLVEKTVPDRPATAPARSPSRVIVLAVAGTVVVLAFALAFLVLGGLSYYMTPLTQRGALKAHRLLRPSGTAGILFGVAGASVMLLTLPYVLRKKIPALARRGSNQRWLDFHIFCGIVGPALITLHTSFKFNGIISVAYWSMVLVVASGFVGRFLYVRIPRSMRGVELSLDEIHDRIDDLKRRSDEAAAAARGTHAMDAEIAALDAERSLLARRLTNLATTKKLFDLWHVFHKPLVYVMFTIAALHVALAVYMGYSVRF